MCQDFSEYETWLVLSDEEDDEVDKVRKKMYKRKFYGLLYLVAFALMLSGCSLSGMSDGSKSAVKGYGITTEAVAETGNGSSEYLSEQERTTEESTTEKPDEKVGNEKSADQTDEKTGGNVTLADIPAYSGAAYCAINDNVPGFSDDELVTDAFEDYSDLDSLGRCGVAYANICKEIMPTEERGEIGMVKPRDFTKKNYLDFMKIERRTVLLGKSVI